MHENDTNLFEETVLALQYHDKTLEDVLWVGGNDYEVVNWQEAMKVDYDRGFGGQKIATDLVVVGDGWWLERAEYDGSEWWAFKTMPARPTEKRETAKFYNGESWATVEEMTREGGKYI